MLYRRPVGFLQGCILNIVLGLRACDSVNQPATCFRGCALVKKVATSPRSPAGSNSYSPALLIRPFDSGKYLKEAVLIVPYLSVLAYGTCCFMPQFDIGQINCIVI